AVGRVEVDARDLAYERRIILESKSVGRIELAGLDAPALIAARIAAVAFQVHGPAGREALVHVKIDPAGQYVRRSVDAHFLGLECGLSGGVRDVRVRRTRAQIGAHADEAIDRPRPKFARGRFDRLARQRRLRPGGAERVAHAAAG